MGGGKRRGIGAEKFLGQLDAGPSETFLSASYQLDSSMPADVRRTSRIGGFLDLLSWQTLASPPPGRGRRIAGIFIGAYLIWQVVLPLSYYFGDDKFDERFAWRMFSVFGWSQKKCTVTLEETAFDVRSDTGSENLKLYMGNFGTLMARNRAAVADKFLRARCRENPWVVKLALIRQCPTVKGSSTRSDILELDCISGDLAETRSRP